jgi:PAS domain-containing protein
VAFSLLAAIAASLVALVVVSRQNLGNGYLAGGSVIMGGGIAGMHYSGMMAMQLAARPVYNPLLVALSVLIAVVVAGAALYLTFRLRHNDQSPVWLRLAAAAIMGLAIASMHYTGMAAVSFQHAPMNAPANLSVSVSSVGVVGIATLTFAVLALSLIASMADRVFSRQKQTLDAEQARWRLLIDANFDGIFDSNRLTGEVFYSPRWQAILGYGPNELEPKIEAWRRLIYPEDKDRVLAALEEPSARRDGVPPAAQGWKLALGGGTRPCDLGRAGPGDSSGGFAFRHQRPQRERREGAFFGKKVPRAV